MAIQWYPGHMEKARREMLKDLKLIDLIIEILDARAPFSTCNPEIDKLGANKARLLILNKSDMADEKENRYWAEHFASKGRKALIVNSRTGAGMKDIEKTVSVICREKIERDLSRGIVNRPVRSMVVGIPNSGKSTFINAYTKKASAKTGNKPGVTRGKQWIRMGKNLELLDTPGILAPKIEREEVGYNLALIGSINDEILDREELAQYFIAMAKRRHIESFFERYEVSDELTEAEILGHIAVRSGALLKGSQPDTRKAALIVIDDLRSGRLGRITVDERQD